jgi:hypothetical protein
MFHCLEKSARMQRAAENHTIGHFKPKNGSITRGDDEMGCGVGCGQNGGRADDATFKGENVSDEAGPRAPKVPPQATGGRPPPYQHPAITRLDPHRIDVSQFIET